MGVIALSGFDWRSALEGTTSGTFAFVTSPVNPGGSKGAFQVNVGTTGLGRIFLPTYIADGTGQVYSIPTAYHTFYFRFGTKPASGDEPFFDAMLDSANEKFELRLNSAGNVVAYDQALALLATGSTVLAADTWYRIEVKVGTGTSAPWEVKIDGKVEISGTGDLTANNNNRAYLGRWANRNSQAVNFFYDDVWIDDAAYRGPHAVVALVPNANGSTMQWTAGTGGSDYQEVDEVPPSDTDYVQSTAINNVALFDLESSDLHPIFPDIRVVLALVRGLENSAGASSGHLRLNSGGSNSDTTARDWGPGITFGKFVANDPATGAPWTKAGLDGVEIGGRDADANPVLRLTAAALMVSFTPPPPMPPPVLQAVKRAAYW